MLKLPSEHRLAAVLRTPGSGIIVTGPDDVLFSGPTVKPENAATADDPFGTVTFEGVDDTVILADRLAFPQPTNPNPETQTLGHDIRMGPVETCCTTSSPRTSARPHRRRAAHPSLTMGANLARGPVITKSARFPVLGNLLAELAIVADLGFRIVQRGDVLVFETNLVRDRSALVRLDIHNNTLAGHRVAISPSRCHSGHRRRPRRAGRAAVPAPDHPRVPGCRSRVGPAHRAVRRPAQDGRRCRADAGRDGSPDRRRLHRPRRPGRPDGRRPMRFGHDWSLGDRVTVVVEGQELVSTVTGYTVRANVDGFRIGAVVGEASGFAADAALTRRVQDTERRVSQLERNSGSTDYGPDIDTLTSGLASVTSRVGAVENTPGATSVARGGILPVLNVAARNGLTGVGDGFQIYRRDRKWIEGWDGSAWRVETTPIVADEADLASITDPQAGMVAFKSDGTRQWVHSGTQWRTRGLVIVTAEADLAGILNPYAGTVAVLNDGTRSGCSGVSRGSAPGSAPPGCSHRQQAR